MSLNMYLGEVQAQTESMNSFCTTTIQGMEQIIHSIDAFALDTVLQGQTYSSAKAYFLQTFRPLAQGIIYLCEELIRQNDAFPRDFQSQVASTDVIEQEILEQIREIDRMIASTEAINQAMPISGMAAIVNLFADMRRKLQEKLEHLYEFNQTSSDNYNTAIQLAASITTGLAEVQSGKGFSPVSGTFSTQRLNMEWIASIQKIAEERVQEAEIKKEIEEKMALQEQEANRPWYQKTAIGAWEFFQGICNSAAENFTGVELPMGNELENKTTFQVGNLVGNFVSGVGSIFEILGGIAIVTGSNVGTVLLEGVTFGAASPIVIPADLALTTAGAGVATHGAFVWYNTVQNSIDTLQRFQYSFGKSGERVMQTVKPNYKDYVKAEKGQRAPNFTPKGAKRGGAFNEAKRASGIPVNEQPTKVTPAVDKRGNPIPGRDYHFKDGKIIREHSGGHTYPDDPSQNRGSHFNDIHGNHYDY
ncbi:MULTISPECIES: HNH/endonuclease VII fold putative polymorphic toxin [Bacillus cereus group]|uniref:HNH/endonuclease VII fold putative polymorphic toxin n=1 Tax=Bacillus cereus group TaxID=86661 RepID=UPI000C286289|nr:HNH/endonuclease VII fold putative polymorphic toxin [Bacillus cereus]MCU5046745.1 T7SS effector LXG polymorphic toxin [Bacillus cereus]MCU5648937.1 T7SS effector LXG polymorphic toxin [Bacillus cereus]